jgi:hypothetical protein
MGRNAVRNAVRNVLTIENELINTPAFMDAKSLQPFISKDLERLIKPIKYLDGGRIAKAFSTEEKAIAFIDLKKIEEIIKGKSEFDLEGFLLTIKE